MVAARKEAPRPTRHAAECWAAIHVGHGRLRTIAIKARSDQGWDQNAITSDLGAQPAEIEAALELEQVA